MPPSGAGSGAAAGARRRGRARWAVVIGMAAAGLAAGVALAWRAGLVPGRLGPLDAARSAYARGDWKAAADAARQRLGESPDDRDAVRLLARASARLGRDEPAKSLFGRLGKDDWQADDYALLGRVLTRLGRPELAVDAWRIALEQDRDQPEALAALLKLSRRGDQQEAAAELAERLSRRPGWEARGLAALGDARAELGDPAAAAEAYKQALDRAPAAAGPVDDDPIDVPLPPAAALRKRLARARLRAGDPSAAGAALAPLETADDPEAAWLLSRVALARGDGAGASAALARSGTYRDDHPLEPEPAPFVGSARCAGCHASVSRVADRARHARTFARPDALGSLPLPPPNAPDPTDPRASHTLTRDGKALRFETKVGDEVFRAVVDYAFGSGDRGLTLVGRDEPGGRARELRLSRYGDADGRGHPGWDVTTGQFPQAATPAGCLGRALSSDQLRGCLVCHVTDPRSAAAGHGPAGHDRAIGCERCHGPGGFHEAAVAAGLADLAVAAETGLAAPAALNRSCGECHSPRGDNAVSPTDPASVRFQATTLTWSRCYTASGEALSCLTCHDPHRDARHDAAFYEARCRACHDPAPAPAGDAPRASICPVNRRDGCLNCHMPVVRTPAVPHSPFTDHHIRVRRGGAAGSP